MLGSDQHDYVIPLPFRLKDPCGIEGRKVLRVRGVDDFKKTAFSIQTEWQMHIRTPRDCDRIYKICMSTNQTKSECRGAKHPPPSQGDIVN